MTKFHVGDRVRVAIRSDSAWNGDVGLVAGVSELGADTYYSLIFEGYAEPVAFVEYELRPADIFAWWKESTDDD